MWDSLGEEGIKCLQRKTSEETNHYILGKSFYFFPAPIAKSNVNHEIDNHFSKFFYPLILLVHELMAFSPT